MKIRPFLIFGVTILSVAALASIPFNPHSRLQTGAASPSLIAGRNVNMVSGTTLPYGDPWLQRQNEPSIAVSTRNPMHLLAGANDYRTVDMPTSEGELPGIPGQAAGDAWLGLFKSTDGGESWTTSLLPGFPLDSSNEGRPSPLKHYTTAADPVVRAATNGLFYYAGISFDRSDRGKNVLFVSRFIDNNNVEGSDPIAYIDTSIVEREGVHEFIDKPWIAVDKPRGGGTVTIEGQSIPASYAYIVFSAFPRGKKATGVNNIFFSMTEDCGKKWSQPVQVTPDGHVCQGATVAVDPGDGEVYIAWRQFASGSDASAIMVAKLQSSKNKIGFSTPVKVADALGFDQASSDGTVDPGTAFRSNSYPSMTIDETGRVYVAWAQRGVGPAGHARIVVATSPNGTNWSACRPVANSPALGHQLMPTLAYAGGKLLVSWYDQSQSAGGNVYGFDDWIKDKHAIRETIDVFLAQADPGQLPQFEDPIQVSRYLYGLDADNNPVQLQYNPPNLPLFKGGTTPFHGDYIDISPSPAFVLDASGAWQFNTAAVSSPVYHVTWTDNRDVRPPSDNHWTNYNPPASDQGAFGSASCGAVDRMGMRNQNIYTAKISKLEAGAAANYKTLGTGLGAYPDGTPIPRMFVLYVKNPTEEIKSFRLHVPSLQGVQMASFLEFEETDTLDVTIGAYSTIARPLFVASSNASGSVTVEVAEIDGPGGSEVEGGLTTSIVLNPDPTNPPFSAGDPVSSAETHNPNIMNPNIMNWTIINPNIMNPNIMNPNIMNPNIINPNIMNSTIANPNIMNPNIMNPNIMNPNIMNPNIMNPNIMNASLADAAVKDVTWRVTNEGNTATSFTFKMFSKEQMPSGIYAQLLVYRVHKVPGVLYATGTNAATDCHLREEEHHEMLLNIANPNIMNPNIMNPNIMNPDILNPNIMNSTFSIPPGEEVVVVLRVIDPAPATFRLLADGSVFDLGAFCESVGAAVVSHAVNTTDAQAGDTTPPADATELIIATTSLPDGIVGYGYSATVEAAGGTPPYVWGLNSGELPPGLSLGSGGTISGTPTQAGLYHFIIEARDQAGSFDTQRYGIYIDADAAADPLTITTTALPSGVKDYWYGATLEATGGVWPRTWSLASGTLPAGLILDGGGTISGTPTQNGTFNFTVRAADAGGGTDTQALSLLINTAAGTTVTISGMVYDSLGSPLDGVVMRGLPGTPVTGETGTAGYYEATVASGWSGTVMPFMVDHVFDPESRTYSDLQADSLDQDYNLPAVLAPEIQAYPHVMIVEKSEGALPPMSLPIRNSGTASLSCDISENVPWMQFNTNHVNLGPGNSYAVQLSISASPPTYPVGTELTTTITLSDPNASNSPFLIPVTVKIVSPPSEDEWLVRQDGGASMDDEAVATASDHLGNVYVTGTTQAGGADYDIVTAKYNAAGSLIWLIRYDGTIGGTPVHGEDCPVSISVDPYENVFVTGKSWNGSNFDYVTLKYLIQRDTVGNEIMPILGWACRYDNGGDDIPSKSAVSISGCVYVTGSSDGSGTGKDYATLKYDPFGNQMWLDRYDNEHGEDVATDLLINEGTTEGQIITVTGYSYDTVTNFDYATIKYYVHDGTRVWRIYSPPPGVEDGVARYNSGGSNVDRAAKTVASPLSGNIFVTGTSNEAVDPACTTLKYGNYGALIWNMTYNNGPGLDSPCGILSDYFSEGPGPITKDTAYVALTSEGSGTGEDIVLIRYIMQVDGGGNEIDPSVAWVRRYNGPGNARDILKDACYSRMASGRIFLLGESTGDSSARDIALMQYDSEGNQIWVQRYSSHGANNDQAGASALFEYTTRSKMYAFAAGTCRGGGAGKDIVVMKADSQPEEWYQVDNGDVTNSDDASLDLVVTSTKVIDLEKNQWSPYGGVYSGQVNVRNVPGPGHNSCNCFGGDPIESAILAAHPSGIYMTGGYRYGGSVDYTTTKLDESYGCPTWPSGRIYDNGGDDIPTAIAVNEEGGIAYVYVTGYSAGAGTGLDFATVKYLASDGTSIWPGTAKRYHGGSGDDMAQAMAVHSSGVYVTGRSWNGSDFDIVTIKYASDGSVLWTARYDNGGGDWPFAAAVDANGDIYVTGESVIVSGGVPTVDTELTTIKYARDGDGFGGGSQLAVHRYAGTLTGGVDVSQATDIAIYESGGTPQVYVTGRSGENEIGGDFVTIRFDDNLTPQWIRRYNGPGNGEDQANDVELYEDAGGGLYIHVAGVSKGVSSGQDWTVVIYDDEGTERKVVRSNGPGNGDDFANALAVDASGNFYVAGRILGEGTEGNNSYIVKYRKLTIK